MRSKRLPRVCSRANCGKRLLKRDGTPDYHRHFCGDECSRADRREKMRAKRTALKTGRCPTCGHSPVRTPREISV